MDVANIVYSDNEAFEDIVHGDKTIEIISYVGEFHAPREVGQVKKYKLFKFVLTNGVKKISCCVWDQLIPMYENEIQGNRILHISGGFAKAVKTTYAREIDGFVPFEITILQSSTVDYLGFHNAIDNPPIAAPVPTPITFDEANDHDKELVIITGYLKQTFRIIESRYGNMSYGYSAICNGQIKINLTVTNYVPSTLEVGVSVTVTGEINQNGGLITITCKDMDSILHNADVEKLSPAELIKSNKFPKRKSELG